MLGKNAIIFRYCDFNYAALRHECLGNNTLRIELSITE
jgi:hypothetical protein